MRHPELLKSAALIFTAASLTVFANAGEDRTIGPGPQPGLEVFDGGAPVGPQPSRYAEVTGMGYTEAAETDGQGQTRAPMEGQRNDLLAEPVVTPQSQQPPYRAPDVRRPPIARVPISRAEDAQAGASAGYADNPFANLDDGASQAREAPPGAYQGQRQAPYPDQSYAAPPPRPVDPVYSVFDNLNTSNPHFQGLEGDMRAGGLPGASQVIWNTLRQRQAQGVYGFSTLPDTQRLNEALAGSAPVSADPLMAAQRLNVFMDAFQSPAVGSPQFASMMPQILTRMNADVQTVQSGLAAGVDDGTFLELARTHVRTVTTCDFFAFPQRQFANDVRQISGRAADMFYPDGSSRAGDVAGITGNLFHIMFMLDRFGQGENWFGRDASITRTLSTPGSFVSAVACPDGTLPNFGPQGSRNLQPVEVKTIEDAFPRLSASPYRVGLAGTKSYPYSSIDTNYAGIYAMRDNYGRRNGRYMAMRCGPLGSLAGVPSHGDFGSLVMMSRGMKYLADPGGYGGMSATQLAHGGVLVNGQVVRPESYPVPGEPVNAVWRTNASIDFLTASAAYPDSKVWQRSVLFVKDLPGETKTDYWVVFDGIDMRDAPETANISVRFPLAPGVSARQEGPGILLTGPNGNGTAMRVYAVDGGVKFGVSGSGQVYDIGGSAAPGSAVTIERNLTGSLTTSTVFYPSDDRTHRPLRIERDADIIRGRTGLIVIDHGLDRMDVIAWAPPKTELVTPTLNLQMSADLGVFRVRKGKIARIDFVNLEKFQAKEPDGGLWTMRVKGPAQTVTIEREFGGGWQMLSDLSNSSSASFEDVNLGPLITGKRFVVRPGEITPIW